MMHDFRLKVFHTVAKLLSFTGASKELYITQPAISKHIKELESDFNLRLFERKGNKILLTGAGKILLKHTGKIFKIYDEIDFELNALNDKYSGSLKLGASTTITQYVLPPVLSQFHDKFPDIKLYLKNENTEQIENALLQHEINLGLVEGRTQNKDLKYLNFMSDELLVVAHRNNKMLTHDVITIEQFVKTPIVLRERGSGTLDVIEYELSKHNIRLSDLNVVMHLGSTESIKSFLEFAKCIGIVSINAVEKELANGQLKAFRVEKINFKRNFDFAYLHGNPEGFADVFIRFARLYYNHR